MQSQGESTNNTEKFKQLCRLASFISSFNSVVSNSFSSLLDMNKIIENNSKKQDG